MSTLTISTIDPHLVAPDDLDVMLRPIHAARTASNDIDMPLEPAETFRVFRAALLKGWGGDPRLLIVAADDSGAVLGHGILTLPGHDNHHLGLLDLHVALEHRRRGLGRRILRHATELCRAHGRRTIVVEAREGSALAAFLAAVGAVEQLVEVHRRQPIAELDLSEVRRLREQAEHAAAGYRLERWLSPTPPEWQEAHAQAALALNDAPTGGLDYEDEHWDAARIAKRDEFVHDAGLRLHVMLAVSQSGEPAGYSEISVLEDGAYGFQWGTGVDPTHRGHRLGLLLKASMVEWLREREPGLTFVSTWNAESNAHMIAINETLGYRAVERSAEWELRV